MRASVAPPGGFHVFIAGEHVSLERTFYLKAIFTRNLPNSPDIATPERDNGVPDMVPTEGDNRNSSLEDSLTEYLARKYHWHLDADQIHLISDTELNHMREEASELWS